MDLIDSMCVFGKMRERDRSLKLRKVYVNNLIVLCISISFECGVLSCGMLVKILYGLVINGKIPFFPPASIAMLAIVNLSSIERDATPGPANSIDL